MTPEDMQALWASHCRYEFELRDVEGALSTMVDDPYLWNIPTLCGGRGQDGMRHYYRDNFVGTMPADAAISSVSLTVGGGKIAHEHIWWDQASVLAQVGLLDPQRVPAFGADTATRLRDLPPL
jgi:carboxymethylenebutenolidase